MTPAQLEPSAKAPCTSTIVGFMLLTPWSCGGIFWPCPQRRSPPGPSSQGRALARPLGSWWQPGIAGPEHLTGEVAATVAEQVRDEACYAAGLARPAGVERHRVDGDIALAQFQRERPGQHVRAAPGCGV